ncbi:lysosomal acid glucosylceramidase-like [Cylas formicarius]|uniref:lysosomal acid glucosylceramidase-like n=1 Tax=Cylas formicarius TaxID=197179 RepID=UPI0029585E2D|nr:lysosomal acid glucosylceramidase-like [Cylas formicarius]
MRVVAVVASLILSLQYSNANDCVQRAEKYGPVCVCNSTYCDNVPDVLDLSSGQYQLYTTSKLKLGFASSTGSFSNGGPSATATIAVPDLKATQQKILGFGGAFTDAASYTILTLPEAAQDKLLQSYFADDGIQYTINRVLMGTSDFSVRGFTNLDEKDETLESFALVPEDSEMKIPVIRKAQQFRGDALKLFLSSWSSPKWMKTIEDYFGEGVLKTEYNQLWADYYIKFFEAYQEAGVEFWGVTAQNEPYTSPAGNVNLRWSYNSLRDWVLDYFGPTLRDSTFKDLKILMLDDNTNHIENFKSRTFERPEILDYLDGIALHWYNDNLNQDSWFEGWPESLFLIGTEACQSVINYLTENKVRLGDWDRATEYIDHIVYDLDHHYTGWVEWNLALNLDGGPSWMNASLDAPIIVNATAVEFYKEPMFYALGHFSKFIVPDSLKLALTTSDGLSDNGIRTVAALRPDGKVAVFVTNENDNSVTIQISIGESSQSIEFAANSINTLLYNV